MAKSWISRKKGRDDREKGEERGMILLNNYVNKIITLQNLLFSQLGESSHLLTLFRKPWVVHLLKNRISITFYISITFAYLLFFIMLKYFIKNHYSRSRDIRLHKFGSKLHWNFPYATKKDNYGGTILKHFWCC